MRRPLAILALAGLMVVPGVAAAQSPLPSLPPVFSQSACVTFTGPLGLDAASFVAGILDGSVVISSLPCETEPEATVEPDPTLEPEATQKPAKVTYKKLSDRTWAKVVKSPDDYFGDAFQVWACISQFDSATGTETFLAQALNKKTTYWYLDGDNALFVGNENQLADFVEDDLVSMNVLGDGQFSYDTQAGGNTTVPMFQVQSIRRRGSCA